MLTNPRAWAYFVEGVVNAWIRRVRFVDDCFQVVWDDDLEDPLVERPCRLEAVDDRGQRLLIGEPHEHVAGKTEVKISAHSTRRRSASGSNSRPRRDRCKTACWARRACTGVMGIARPLAGQGLGRQSLVAGLRPRFLLALDTHALALSRMPEADR